ncbi:hypothetical protein B0H19DRAFT_1058953 [Mycena capillaripes]|nr:hypothetical protein B0H19DRAFT_1058953 [Mycena capillaripes]
MCRAHTLPFPGSFSLCHSKAMAKSSGCEEEATLSIRFAMWEDSAESELIVLPPADTDVPLLKVGDFAVPENIPSPVKKEKKCRPATTAKPGANKVFKKNLGKPGLSSSGIKSRSDLEEAIGISSCGDVGMDTENSGPHGGERPNDQSDLYAQFANGVQSGMIGFFRISKILFVCEG